MHEKRIMHRDLKPANIFLTLDGTVKLGDFGLSRELSEHTFQAHSKVGTPLYMSPEVLRGDGYDFKSDIWSMGCLLYELAMLKSPFKAEGLNLYSLFLKISRGDYEKISDDFSYELRSLVSSMIRIKSEDRPSLELICEVAQKMRRLKALENKKKNDSITTDRRNTSTGSRIDRKISVINGTQIDESVESHWEDRSKLCCGTSNVGDAGGGYDDNNNNNNNDNNNSVHVGRSMVNSDNCIGTRRCDNEKPLPAFKCVFIQDSHLLDHDVLSPSNNILIEESIDFFLAEEVQTKLNMLGYYQSPSSSQTATSLFTNVPAECISMNLELAIPCLQAIKDVVLWLCKLAHGTHSTFGDSRHLGSHQGLPENILKFLKKMGFTVYDLEHTSPDSFLKFGRNNMYKLIDLLCDNVLLFVDHRWSNIDYQNCFNGQMSINVSTSKDAERSVTYKTETAHIVSDGSNHQMNNVFNAKKYMDRSATGKPIFKVSILNHVGFFIDTLNREFRTLLTKLIEER